VVTQSVPAGTVVAGNPARPITTWESFQERLSHWPAAADMVGTSYRECVDSIAERECLPVRAAAPRQRIPEQRSSELQH